MKYMLLLATDLSRGPQEGTPEYDAEMARWGRLNQEMKDAGVYVLASGLQLPESATTLRAPGGDPVLTDGPYAETKDQIAGFDVLECADLDEAIEVASKHPMAWAGLIELRPFWDDDAD
jgi:hypothetical protein